MRPTPELVCHDCGRRGTDPFDARCACGEPRWFGPPSDATWPPDGGGETTRPPTRLNGGTWRYREFLPVDPPTGVGAGGGGTPLVRTPALDDGARTWVKVEGTNPTGTFKDRGTAVGLAAAVEADVPWVGTVSHGNMARSVAAHAAAHGMPCVVLVPDDIPPERLGPIARYDPTLVAVSGSYGDLYDESLAFGRDRGIAFLNSDVPLRVAGQKTLTLEVLDAFHPDPPDALVLPVSSGGNASAAHRALLDLVEIGALGADAVPRLYVVQAAACDPIAGAYRRGDDEVTATTPGETVAYSIANPDPPSGTRALWAARATGGAAVSVDDDAIRAAKRELAVEAGRDVEASSATTLAALRRLRADGEIRTGERVVLVATGTGRGEDAGVEASPERATVGSLGTDLDAMLD